MSLYNQKNVKIFALETLAIIIFTYLCVGLVIAPPNNYTVDVSIIGSGSVVKVPDHPHYRLNDTVQLTAEADPGWSFSEWGGDVAGSENPVSISIDGDKSITATFTQSEYTLSISTSGSGNVTKVPEQLTYHYGDVVQLMAQADPGWKFSAWSGDATGSKDSVKITIDGDKSVVAAFMQNEYALTATIVGGGSVSKSPDQVTYHLGDNVQLTASPSEGYVFSGWGGDASGVSSPKTITMDGDKDVIATFTEILANQYTVAITAVGGGHVDLDPQGGVYGEETKVQLTAVADTGWIFMGWSGDLSGALNPQSITVDENKSVTATFTQTGQTLTVIIVGSGSVSRDPPGPYDVGDLVQLSAVADPGWSFSVWGGDLTSSINPVNITLDGPKNVTATFTQNEYTLTVIVNPAGCGTVTRNPDQLTYSYGESVALSQVPVSGYTFRGWSGGGVNSGANRVVSVTGNMDVTANYVAKGGGGGGGGWGGGGGGGVVVIVPEYYAITFGLRDQEGNRNLGEILLSGVGYNLPFSLTMVKGDYSISCAPAVYYHFDHWETLGDVDVTDSKSISTTLVVRGKGLITAVCTPIMFKVTLGSKEENGTSENLGSYSMEGVAVGSGAALDREVGNYTVTFHPSPGYVLYKWDTSGGVTIKSSMNDSTSLFIHGNGGVTAVYLIPRGDIRILVEDTEGNGVPNATVTVTQPPRQGSQLVALTDSEGSLLLRDVIIGQYNVSVSKEDCVDASLTVWPKMNSLVTGRLPLAKQNYSLTIRVLDQSESPVSGVNVTLFGGPIGWQPVRHSTDSSGVTTFNGVCLRKYFVLVGGKGFLSQIVGLVIEDADNKTYAFTLASSQVENETLSQPQILAEVIITVASIGVLLALIFSRGLVTI